MLGQGSEVEGWGLRIVESWGSRGERAKGSSF
jgi:hypothetical protein